MISYGAVTPSPFVAGLTWSVGRARRAFVYPKILDETTGHICYVQPNGYPTYDRHIFNGYDTQYWYTPDTYVSCKVARGTISWIKVTFYGPIGPTPDIDDDPLNGHRVDGPSVIHQSLMAHPFYADYDDFIEFSRNGNIWRAVCYGNTITIDNYIKFGYYDAAGRSKTWDTNFPTAMHWFPMELNTPSVVWVILTDEDDIISYRRDGMGIIMLTDDL